MTTAPFLDSIVAALRRVLPETLQIGGLHEPHFGGNEWRYVKECLDTGWVSSVGSYVDRFEAMLSDYTGAAHAVAVVNGTAALHLCLRIAGVERGDEVLLPTLTFIATANAVAYCGATPHFADSDRLTLGVDPAKLRDYLKQAAEVRQGICVNRRTGARIRAVIVMHTFGHPADLDGLTEVCREFGVPLIEDAAESLGSFYKARHTGNWGLVSALSFNGNKVATTGGGGAVLTNDERLGRIAKHLSTTARVAKPWFFEHDQIGYNYRLPNINAALGCAQLEQMPVFIERKRALAERYVSEFQDVCGVQVFREPAQGRGNYWLNTLVLDADRAGQRDELLEVTNQCGIPTRPVWTLLHRLPIYARCPRMDLSVAEDLERRIINLPSSAALGAPYVRS